MRRYLKIFGWFVMVVLPAGVQYAQRDAGTPSVDEQFFLQKVYPALEKAECRNCHNDNGVGSATRVQFPPPEADAAAVQAFGLKLSAVVDRANAERSLLVRKPTLRVAHAGGERIAKGSAEEGLLKSWAVYLAKLPVTELNAALARLGAGQRLERTVALRRLTHSQYNNTVRDLLGDFTRPADHFPQEDFLHGFTNQAEGQSIPPLLAEAYTVASEKLAANAFRRGGGQNFVPCKPASASDAACRDQFIRKFGLKAFRRPLSAAEAKGYSALFSQAATEQGDFFAGAKLVIEAMLQSPSFLFHLEGGPDGRSRQYSVASRLSYFLWDTMPDEDLLRAAEAGELASEEAIRKTARRMMDNPQAKRSFEGFLAQWMRFDRVLGSARNVRRYPDFGPSLLAAMTEETKHLFNHVVWNDRNFMEMFNADYTFLSVRLAQLYGVQAPAEDFGMAMYPKESNRAGMLGHAGFLTMTGNPTETSPTSRGLFVREHFLCQTVPPPPPGVDTTLPPVTAEKPMTSRERLGVHVAPSCAGCHSLIDPIGLGLEGFDNIGRSRDKVVLRLERQRDAVTNQRREPEVVELPLDTNGHIQGIANSRFSNIVELGNILANDPTCQRCMVKQIFRYAVGRHENQADQKDLDALYETFRSSGFQFRQLLLALVSSKPFLGEQDSESGRVASRK